MENKQMELAKVREKWIMSMENATKSRSGRPLRNRSGRQVFPEVVRQRRQVLQGMAKPLKRWLIKHRDNPYPTKAEKISLALGSQMTLMQVSNWFANARRRLKNTVKTPNADWSKRIKMYNSCVVGNAELLSISSDDSIWDSDDIESEMILSHDPNPQDRQTNEDHSYSALEGLMVHSDLPEQFRTSSTNIGQQIPTTQSSKTPETQSVPVVRCKRSRETLEDETVFSDEASCKVQYDYRPKKYKRHIMQRYLYDSYHMSKQEQELTECSNQNVSCQRTEKSKDSVGGSCSESETSPSISRSPSSTCTDSAADSRLSEVEVSQDLVRTKVTPLFSNERLKNGRYWKEFDAAIVLANLGQTTIVRSSESNNPPISTTCS